MDWHLVDDPRVAASGASGWTGYSWNRALIGDPPAFIAELHRRRLRIALNDHPAEGVQPYEDLYGAVSRALGRDPARGRAVEFDMADPDFRRVYFDPLLRALEADGVDFWWIDWQQGRFSSMPGADPLWLLNDAHYGHSAARLARGHGLILSRYAGPGSHRYPVGFSGDTVASWPTLAFQPEFTATASNIGFGWWSHDIGGHMLGARCDALAARWVQLGVFSPILRLHSTKSRWVAKEPWSLPGGPAQSPGAVVAAFMRLRHRLIPYLHTMNARAADPDGGEPLVQPMYWHYPDRDEAYAVPTQYMFGSAMLVAPITTPQNAATHTAKVRAWLPPGIHVDFFSGHVYDGDRSLWLSRTLDSLPVLLNQGAIVPLDGNPEPENGADNPDSIELVVVVGHDGHFELLEEDEHPSRDGEPPSQLDWVRTPIALNQAQGTLTIGPTKGRHQPRAWSVRLLGFKPSAGVRASVDGEALEPETTLSDNGLVVSLGDVAPGSSAVVSLGADPQLAINDPRALMEPILFSAEVEYRLKDKIDAVMSPKLVPKSGRASQLEALDMDPDLCLLLTELLFADSRS